MFFNLLRWDSRPPCRIAVYDDNKFIWEQLLKNALTQIRLLHTFFCFSIFWACWEKCAIILLKSYGSCTLLPKSIIKILQNWESGFKKDLPMERFDHTHFYLLERNFSFILKEKGNFRAVITQLWSNWFCKWSKKWGFQKLCYKLIYSSFMLRS